MTVSLGYLSHYDGGIMVELIITMKTKFTSSNAEKTNEKTNGFISPQMSNFHKNLLFCSMDGSGMFPFGCWAGIKIAE